MAKRRKVGNVLGLAVLATLVAKPMHPYEVASLLRTRGKEHDMPLRWGSLYTVVGNLEKHGFIAVVENVRHGGRPERTVYRITDAGRAELADWVRELIAEPEPEQPRFMAGLSVAGVLHPDEVTELLAQRRDRMRERLDNRREELARYATEVPRLFLIETEYELALQEAEFAWVESFLDELTTGSFPMLSQWREWHADNWRKS